MTINTGSGFTDVVSDSGTAKIVGGKPNLSIVGDTNIDTSATGSTVTATMAMESGFHAFVDGDVANVTGDATSYVIICDSEAFDISGDYDTTTGLYTSPKTGKYYFSGTISLNNIGASHDDCRMFLETRNAANTANVYAFQYAEFNPANARDVGNEVSFSGSLVINMTAGEHARLRVIVSGSTLTVGVNGGATGDIVPKCEFSGILLGE